MFKRILIANRGEIACRITRTCRRLGIESVAVYSEADQQALHVREADVAIEIGGARPNDSYLNIDRVLKAAHESGAEAVHPGYGFLAENARFAKACADAGLVFIGPRPTSIERMGSKAEARALMESANVPVVPGYHGEDQDDDTLKSEAERIGYPMMLKPAAGGGGKGMRIVRRAEDFAEALESARREADNAFGDTRMILERYVERPRHIEFQVFGDESGNVIHLNERECSVQRRYQKIIEETPSPFLDDETRARMGKAAVQAAKAVDYIGAGTVEFIVGEDREFFFMEMNTRLQVEHPVTEMVTNLDLVEWQLRIAAGEPLPLTQEQVSSRGHAIEARIYAENPEQGFLPSSGRLDAMRLPAEGANLRLDAGVEEGDVVSVHYDPMIAKLIVHDATRQAAVGRLQRALGQSYIFGPATNLGFLLRLAHHSRFRDAAVDTGYLDRHLEEILPKEPEPPVGALLAATLHHLLTTEYERIGESLPGPDPYSPWSLADAWHPGLPVARQILLRFGGEIEKVEATGGNGYYLLQRGETTIEVTNADLDQNGIRYCAEGIWENAWLMRHGDVCAVTRDGARWLVEIVNPFSQSAAAADEEHRITAPMPGRVVAVKTREGDTVKEGQGLVVIEAMKMEITLRAPHDGKVARVLHEEGDFVEADVALVELEAGDD